MHSTALILCISLTASLGAQTNPPRSPGKRPATAQKTPTKEQNFVLQTIRTAVGLPQPDPQDRLRVLHSAATVAATISPQYAAKLAREGVQIETSLVASGQTPVVSIVASTLASCAVIKTFVDSLYPQTVPAAEQALIGAVSKCPQVALEPVRQKTDFAMEKGLTAPRLLMALMEKTGAQASWTRDHFEKLFSSLPDPKEPTAALSAPDYAAMYSAFAKRLPDLARASGIKLFEWLGKMEPSPQRSAALNITKGAMEDALGKEKFQEFIAGNVMIRQLLEQKGPPPDVGRGSEESASVLRAMGGTGTEQQAELLGLPPSLRAREAAAHGFARGIAKDKDSANRFFDLAFSAAEETWSKRNTPAGRNAPAVIQEVCQAAAQVDAIDALRRAQGFQDPTAQAIGMIAVARVVAGRDTR